MESPRIRVLDAAVIDHIAAGEVVERPASVVKELVENAFDAGAQTVQVDLDGGGLTGITVTDDGVGMTPVDARLCILRHATSKLRTSADLFRIKTLGFRGEALSSIASVSHLTITTRPADARTGFRLEMRGGEIVSEQEVGCPRGTSIQVCELFYNTPARRKFMRASATEQAHVADAVLRVGMGYRRGGILLMAGSRRLVDIPEDAQGHKRIVAALGARVGKLSQLTASQDGVHVEGFVSAPELDRGETKGLWLFVNGRFVRDRMLQRALTECYPAMEAGRYPTAIIHVDMDPEAVDVNVHPQKLEVRFADATAVYQVLTTALRNAFPPPASEDTQDANDAETRDTMSARQPRIFASTASAWSLPGPRWTAPAVARTTVVPAVPTTPVEPRGFFGRLNVLATVGPFALLGARERTYVLDLLTAAQTCAAAALNQERSEDGAAVAQSLLFPLRVDIPRPMQEQLHKHGERLRALGFDVEPTGPESFVLKAVPKPLTRAEPTALLAHALTTAWTDETQARAVLEACIPLVSAPKDAEGAALLLQDLDRARVLPEEAGAWFRVLKSDDLQAVWGRS